MEMARKIRREMGMKWGRIKGGKIDIWIEEISDNAWCYKSFSTLQSGAIAPTWEKFWISTALEKIMV
jgi:hypothetical protein